MSLNAVDVLLLVLIGLLLALAVRRMVKNRREGKLCSGCTGSCPECGKKG